MPADAEKRGFRLLRQIVNIPDAYPGGARQKASPHEQ
jgi:hypothetical protein